MEMRRKILLFALSMHMFPSCHCNVLRAFRVATAPLIPTNTISSPPDLVAVHTEAPSSSPRSAAKITLSTASTLTPLPNLNSPKSQTQFTNSTFPTPTITSNNPPLRSILQTATVGQLVHPSGFAKPFTLSEVDFELNSLIEEAKQSDATVTKQSVEVKQSLPPLEFEGTLGPVFVTVSESVETDVPGSRSGTRGVESEAGGFSVAIGESGVGGGGVEVTTTESFRLFVPTTTIVSVPGATTSQADETEGEPSPFPTNIVFETDSSTSEASPTATGSQPQQGEDTKPAPRPTTRVVRLPPSSETNNPSNPTSRPKPIAVVVTTQLITLVTRPDITLIRDPSNSAVVVVINSSTLTLATADGTVVVSGGTRTVSTSSSPISGGQEQGGEVGRKVLILTDGTTTRTLAVSEITNSPLSTSGTRRDQGVVIGNKTLTAGGVITIDDETLSLAPSGRGVVVGSRTVIFKTDYTQTSNTLEATAIASSTSDAGGRNGSQNPSPTTGSEVAGAGAVLPDVDGESAGERIGGSGGGLWGFGLTIGAGVIALLSFWS